MGPEELPAPPAEAQPHELVAFLEEASQTMAAEYERIRRRAVSDPGTAGDEGEENWRELLEDWLPRELAVVTKGRILSHDGRTSPQVDVLVLRPGYPKTLQGKKTYLAAGVLAAFECKLTLRTEHIAAAAETARAVRNLIRPRNGTPYGELHSPIIFGLLAHSTALRRSPLLQIDAALAHALGADSHPRETLDAVCVANLGLWFGSSMVTRPLPSHLLNTPMADAYRAKFGPPDQVVVTNFYMRWHGGQPDDPVAPPPPLYLLFERLIKRIAYEMELYRPVADYWRETARGGAISIASRRWPQSILSGEAGDGVAQGTRGLGSRRLLGTALPTDPGLARTLATSSFALLQAFSSNALPRRSRVAA
jgi:hypothetical protein